MSGLNTWTRRVSAWRWSGAAVLALAASWTLSGCAPMPAGPEEFDTGRTRVVLSNTDWEDLGATNEVLPLLVGPGNFPLQTRALGLRGAKGEWLAVMLVQSNRSDQPRTPTQWTGTCPLQQGMLVEDAAAGSPVRVDCLRFKRWASSEGWLAKNHPDLVRWMADNRVQPRRPYSHLNYRFATEGGSYVEVNAMVDHRLLRPPTRNNEEFLRAGYPAQAWSHQVAEAARRSTGMVDGFFPVPPFPLPVPD